MPADKDGATPARKANGRRLFLAAALAGCVLLAAPPARADLSGAAYRKMIKDFLKIFTSVFTGGFPIAWEGMMKTMNDQIKDNKTEEQERFRMSMGSMGDHVANYLIDRQNHERTVDATNVDPLCGETTYPIIVDKGTGRVRIANLDNGRAAANASVNSSTTSRAAVVNRKIQEAYERAGPKGLSAAVFCKSSGYTPEEEVQSLAFLTAVTASVSAWGAKDTSDTVSDSPLLESQRSMFASASNLALATLDDIRNRRVRMPTQDVAGFFAKDSQDLAEQFKRSNPGGRASVVDLLRFEADKGYSPITAAARRNTPSSVSLYRSLAMLMSFNNYLNVALQQQQQRTSLLQAAQAQLATNVNSASKLQNAWQQTSSEVEVSR